MAVEPIATFTREHPTSGDKQTRHAYTPDEVVNLTADGWVQKPNKTTGSTAGSAAEKPAGAKPSSS